MAFYAPTSRYKFDTSKVTASRKSVRGASQYTFYVVREGDTLESVARRSLGSSDRWWEVADLNPQIKYPLSLTVGDVIRLPR